MFEPPPQQFVAIRALGGHVDVSALMLAALNSRVTMLLMLGPPLLTLARAAAAVSTGASRGWSLMCFGIAWYSLDGVVIEALATPTAEGSMRCCCW